MLTIEDMNALAEADDKRLGIISSEEFMKLHNEIMTMADCIQSRYRKNAPISTANTDRSE